MKNTQIFFHFITEIPLLNPEIFTVYVLCIYVKAHITAQHDRLIMHYFLIHIYASFHSERICNSFAFSSPFGKLELNLSEVYAHREVIFVY